MTIRRANGGFRLTSKKTGRNLGTFPTKAAAQKRENQVTFFKNLAKSSGGPGSLRSKVRKKSLLKRR